MFKGRDPFPGLVFTTFNKVGRWDFDPTPVTKRFGSQKVWFFGNQRV